MSMDQKGKQTELSRREFLTAAGGVAAGAAATGLAGKAQAGEPKPGRGGTLRIATRSDTVGLEPHRNNYYYVSVPISWIGMGLLDLNTKLQPVQGIATEWTASKDLLTYTFNLRKGALFHNGREIDAAAVKWNYDRIKQPTTHPFVRGTLVNLKETEVVDKYTVRCHLHNPSAAFPANVVYYPAHLMAPDTEAQAAEHPI
ncbi:MAG: ABC transporter substrate-binding protein, partial [bacterium]|nr:ABC transporter substrate-binding protein [bacterium]